MEQTSSPKHAKPSDGTEKHGFLSSLQAGDVAAWAQAGIMASPLFAYLFVYSLKHYSYTSFGVSTALITVEFEDVLWMAAAFVLPCVVVLTQWGFTAIDSMNHLATTIWFVGLIPLCVLLSLAIFTLVLGFRSKVFDWLPYLFMFV